MDLHQVQVTYVAEEDRLLLRASFKAEDGTLQEVRAWLTRRLLRVLWPGILNVLEKQVALDNPTAAHASADIVGMEHHALIEEIRDSGSFGNTYETNIASLPLGDAPILVTRVDFAQNPNQPIRVNFLPAEGYGFEIGFTLPILHGLCSLLKDVVRDAEWDVSLAMPGALPVSPSSRTLN